MRNLALAVGLAWLLDTLLQHTVLALVARRVNNELLADLAVVLARDPRA